MSNPISTPTVQEYPFQMFVYGRFLELDGHKGLTEMQKRVRAAVRKYPTQAEAAKSLGVSPQCIQGHVSLIISKGWSI